MIAPVVEALRVRLERRAARKLRNAGVPQQPSDIAPQLQPHSAPTPRQAQELTQPAGSGLPPTSGGGSFGRGNT